jgi:hypothetical protein
MHLLAHSVMVSIQLASIVLAGRMVTLSNILRFLANQIFQTIAMKMVPHSFQCAGHFKYEIYAKLRKHSSCGHRKRK